MSHALRVGVADQIGYFRAYNTDGSAKTDLTSATTGLALSVFRIGAAAVSISSLSAKAADNTAHSDGAIRAVSGNLYTVDLPDAACADQVPSISVKGSYTGGVIEGPEHPMVGYNPASVAVGALTTLGANAPADWFNAASISADAGAEIAALVETYIVNEGDATAVMQAIADKIAADWVAGDASPIAIATAVWSAGSRTITGGSLTTSPPTAEAIADAVWDESRSGHTTAGTFGFYIDAAISSRLAPTISGRTLNVNTDGEGDAVLDSGALLGALGLEAGNLDEQLADILAASGGGGGGGGGGGFTEEQTALLVSIARWAARNNGGPMHYTGNVGDGGVLELTINDDHETAIENDLPIVVKDPDGLLHAKLTASGATLSWSAGQDNVGGLITGTVTAPTHDEDTALTTIVVQVPNCPAAGNITTPYKWQMKRTSGGKIKTELQGTLRLNADMS